MEAGTKPQQLQKARAGRGRPRKGAEPGTDTLLDSALKSFAENGFENTSLRTIAMIADVDVALISYRYGSKFGLWSAVVSSIAEESVQSIDRFIADSLTLPAKQRVEYVAEQLVEMIVSKPHFARLMIGEVAGTPNLERQSFIAEKLGNPIHTKLRNFLDEHSKDAKLIDGDLAVFASISLLGHLSTTQFFLSEMVGIKYSERELKSQMTRIVTGLLTR
ncbi:TetR family transcriptional regulator [Rhizobium sp. FKY42]|uniref:TetR/AcrR family transcriptional regulator n=1 Tax=Rhizobium sp. FKY42 TaxID=2562310 RepID=UPI001485BC7C|nr:TetR family transcriptional regulator [Rhizobium sp. FKY42]